MSDWLKLCGYELTEDEKYSLNSRSTTNELSKLDCERIIRNMQSLLDRPIMYDDFRHPHNGTIGITQVRKYWGTVNNMKKALGLEIIQESMIDKSVTKNGFNKEISLICDYLKSENRSFITTREINALKFCSSYYTLQRDCLKYYQRNLVDFMLDKGVLFGKQGRGLQHIFDDGENTSSQYEYIFSKYLKEYGLKYGDNYFRDVRYSDFIPNYSKNMNCDYVIHYKNIIIYIEIAGVIDKYKKWYYENKPITKSKSKEEYRKKLKLKEELLQSEQLEYYFLFPCDLIKDVLNMILESEDHNQTRKDIEKFSKNNIEWDKIRQISKLKCDFSKIGRDKRSIPIY